MIDAPLQRGMLRYNPAHSLSYGVFVCLVCGSSFYGGGQAIHDPKCPDYRFGGYRNCLYEFGPKEVEEMARSGRLCCSNGLLLYSPRGDRDLRTLFPELLAEFPELAAARETAKVEAERLSEVRAIGQHVVVWEPSDAKTRFGRRHEVVALDANGTARLREIDLDETNALVWRSVGEPISIPRLAMRAMIFGGEAKVLDS